MNKPLLCILTLGSFVSAASAAVVSNVNESISLGRQALTNHHLVEARQWFSNAVHFAPNHATGNVLLAATRLAALPEAPVIESFLDRLGFSAAGRDLFNWQAEPTRDTNNDLVLPEDLNTREAVSLVRHQVLPAIIASLENLSRVRNPAFLLALTAEETSTEAVIIDYGDVLLARAFLHAAEFYGYTLNAHNLAVNVNQVRRMERNDELTIETFLAAYPDFLRFANPGDILISRAALQNGLRRYQDASAFIRRRPAGVERLFNLETNRVEDEREFRTEIVPFILGSLTAPTKAEPDDTSTWYLGAYFQAVTPLRSVLPRFSDNMMVRGSLPDPTFGGVLSGLSRQMIENRLADDFGLTNRAELVRPLVSIIAPTPSQRVLDPAVLIRGTASDNRGVAYVEYQLNGSLFELASGTNTWAATITARPGLNTVRARSVDIHGNESLLVSRSFYYAASDRLHLSIVGNGRVVGPQDGTLLELSREFTWTALPGSNALFYAWGGDVSSLNPVVRHPMQSNFTLIAYFIPNPFLPARGGYNGLFYPTNSDQVTPTNAGYFTLTLTGQGAFSGRLLLSGSALPFTGRFTADGRSALRVPRFYRRPLDMTLTLGSGVQSNTISGTLTDGAWQAEIKSDLAAPPRGTVTRFTFALEDPAGGTSNAPAGTGAGTMRLGVGGAVVMAATLGDGVAVSQTTTLSREGLWPFYAAPYGGKGLVLGWVRYDTNAAPMELNNDTLRWIKPPLPLSRLYPAGFDVEYRLAGGRYSPPAVGQSVLTWTNGSLLLTDGNLTNELQRVIVLRRYAVNFPAGNPEHFVISINPVDGTFSGTFIHPVTGRQTSLKGVWGRQWNQGLGWFLGRDQSGPVLFREAMNPLWPERELIPLPGK